MLQNEVNAMNKLTFYRGLLYALRQRRDSFVAEGERFHDAFASTVELAGKEHPPDASPPAIHLDPLFGAYREANEMLIEGEQDLLLSLLNPRHRQARFRIDANDALNELQGLPNPAWFLRLGQHFHERLSSAG